MKLANVVRGGRVVGVMVLFTLLSMRPAYAGGVVGSGTPGSCTEAALNTALSGGGTVTFNCGAAPHTIPISVKTIVANTTINGGGKITLDGQNAERLFVVNGGVTLTLRNIILTKGFSFVDGGRSSTTVP